MGHGTRLCTLRSPLLDTATEDQIFFLLHSGKGRLLFRHWHRRDRQHCRKVPDSRRKGQAMNIMKFCALLGALIVMNGAQAAEEAKHASELDDLKSKYEDARASIEATFAEQRSDALATYSRALDAYKIHLKQAGQLQAYLRIEEETIRLKQEQKPPTERVDPNVDRMVAAHDKAVEEASAAEQKQMAALANQYDAKLNALIKTLMQADQIEEAKRAQRERNRAKFILAVIEDQKPPAPAPHAPPQKQPPVPQSAIAFGGHHYGIVGKLLTWQAAKKACEDMGGHLVVFSSARELNAVVPLVSKAIAPTKVKTCWIGYHLNADRWEAVTGEPLTYLNWRKGEPNHSGGNEDVSVLREDGFWADASRTEILRPAICEWDY